MTKWPKYVIQVTEPTATEERNLIWPVEVHQIEALTRITCPTDSEVEGLIRRLRRIPVASAEPTSKPAASGLDLAQIARKAVVGAQGWNFLPDALLPAILCIGLGAAALTWALFANDGVDSPVNEATQVSEIRALEPGQAVKLTPAIAIQGDADVAMALDGNKGAEVTLERGFVEIAVDPKGDGRHLRIDAGSAVITVKGTRFSVYRKGEEVTVGVKEGKVEVLHGQERMLVRKGEMWASAKRGESGPPKRAAGPAVPATRKKIAAPKPSEPAALAMLEKKASAKAPEPTLNVKQKSEELDHELRHLANTILPSYLLGRDGTEPSISGLRGNRRRVPELVDDALVIPKVGTDVQGDEPVRAQGMDADMGSWSVRVESAQESLTHWLGTYPNHVRREEVIRLQRALNEPSFVRFVASVEQAGQGAGHGFLPDGNSGEVDRLAGIGTGEWRTRSEGFWGRACRLGRCGVVNNHDGTKVAPVVWTPHSALFWVAGSGNDASIVEGFMLFRELVGVLQTPNPAFFTDYLRPVWDLRSPDSAGWGLEQELMALTPYGAKVKPLELPLSIQGVVLPGPSLGDEPPLLLQGQALRLWVPGLRTDPKKTAIY